MIKSKALQKAKYSDFCSFAKIETRFIQYYYKNILSHLELSQNTKHGIERIPNML